MVHYELSKCRLGVRNRHDFRNRLCTEYRHRLPQKSTSSQPAAHRHELFGTQELFGTKTVVEPTADANPETAPCLYINFYKSLNQ